MIGEVAFGGRLFLQPSDHRPRAGTWRPGSPLQGYCLLRASPTRQALPGIYLEAALRLGVDTQRTVAVEDSHSGILAARAAGMRVIAIPNRRYPPGEGALAKADAMLEDVSELTPEAVEGTG